VRRTVTLGAALAAALICAKPAAAYVRYTSSTGKMFKWSQSCVQLTAYPADLEPMMPVEEVLGAVDASAATWSTTSDACTYLDLMVSSSTDPTPRATNDGHNLVIFRTTNWCKLAANGTCDPAVQYDPAALALTSVSASTSSGAIRDADIEVNAFHFQWADLVTHPELRGAGMSFHDLQNAVTHEMGHLIGLDHTCYFQPPAPIDATGAPIPDCADASPAVLATTMFPSANPGDIDKRTLAPDDQMAVCDIYPAAENPMSCTPQGMSPPGGGDGCACAAAGAPAPAGLVVLIAAALLLARARRRRV
jgi:MYXO-CTERM domain-containing protein